MQFASSDIDSHILQGNIGRLHTTEMGVERIRRNLALEDIDVVEWCRSRIREEKPTVERKGKNWYVQMDDCVIVVHAGSYTIITAHKVK